MTQYEGWLDKKGHLLGFWHKRYCVVDDHLFNIFADKEKTKLKRTIELNFQTKIEINSNNGKFQFNIKYNNKIYYFAVKSENEYIEWLNILLQTAQPPNKGISRDMFENIAVLGRGYYGKVTLARYKETGQLVAIKSIHKKDLVDKQKVETVMAERAILTLCNNPFIVKLLFSFQSPSKFYLVLEYEKGGDVFHYLKKADQENVDMDVVKLVVAELAVALQYLHSKNIIYRDLKPENVLFCMDGHIKLTDFGISKVLSCRDEVTKTMCGTGEYLAPEVILGKEYSFSVDWWQLGILMYEMIVGRTPFKDDNNAVMYQKITNKRVGLFPIKDQDARELISHLLKKEPNERAGFEDIKNSGFFKDYNWETVENRGLQPTFIPKSISEEDVGNFDSAITKESVTESLVMPVSSYFAGFTYVAPSYEDE